MVLFAAFFMNTPGQSVWITAECITWIIINLHHGAICYLSKKKKKKKWGGRRPTIKSWVKITQVT